MLLHDTKESERGNDMKLNLVSFGTKDLDQSVRFYTELAKLKVVRRLQTWDMNRQKSGSSVRSRGFSA